MPTVRAPRAVQCRAAEREARRREDLSVLPALTNCPKTQSTNIYDRCKARYEGLSTPLGSFRAARKHRPQGRGHRLAIRPLGSRRMVANESLKEGPVFMPGLRP